mgnify:CR=1 FL=1
MNGLILLNCEQGSEAWHQARLGIPTASLFDRIVTASGKARKQATGYLAELLAEHITGQAGDNYQSADMQRGVELEPAARACYELETGHDVIQVGGVYLDDSKNIMASPDGLIAGMTRGLEIKCPKLATHIRYILEDALPTQYTLQVQGGMWVTGYDEWDFVSYCPEYDAQPIYIKTIKRNTALIAQMDKHIRAFSARLETLKQRGTQWQA